MSDPIFFLRDAQLSLADLVALTGASVDEGADLSAFVYGAAPVEEAEPGDLACFADAEPPEALAVTHATACFVSARFAARLPASTVALVTENPQRAFAAAVARMFPAAIRPGSLFAAAGVNPGAAVHPQARLEPGVVIDPGVVIGPRAEIGSGSIIAANCVIGPGVRIGRDCSVGAAATIVNALIGNRALVHPGVRIGQAGSCSGPPAESYPPPRIGRVIIQDDVEIGANSAVDRGSSRDTVIGEGTKIGNLVQIGSDAVVGRACRILPLASIGAAVRIGDFVRVEGPAIRGDQLLP